jgi:hypothetical protein
MIADADHEPRFFVNEADADSSANAAARDSHNSALLARRVRVSHHCNAFQEMKP